MKKLMMAVMVAAAAFGALADDYSFTYQAELKNDKGQSLESRNQTVEIRLWKNAAGTSAGDLLWGRTYSIYTDENGLFNQEVSDALGSPTVDDPGLKLSAVFCNNGAGAVYLGLKVKDSAGEIVPRQRLFAVPFAGRANSANNLVGDAHNVEGKLNFPGGSSLATSGLILPYNSSSSLGGVTAESLACSNGITAANVAFTGKLTGPNGKEIIPVPVGGVIMWTKDTPPEGGEWDSTGKGGHWAICNGENGTPNLSGRFVVGVKEGSSDYALKQTGGEEKHKLTIAEMPNHQHHLGNSNDWWHVEVDDETDFGFSVPYAFADKHGITGKSGKDSYGDTNCIGGDKPHENRPPYYALYYIMRIK